MLGHGWIGVDEDLIWTNTKLAYLFLRLLLQHLELLQCCLGLILMGEVLHEEIPEDHPVLCHFACLLYVPGGGDIFE